jgi:hypothetical protein
MRPSTNPPRHPATAMFVGLDNHVSARCFTSASSWRAAVSRTAHTERLMAPDAHNRPTASPDALIASYQEICKSYHAIDDFRMKLLGLLPFTSLAAILLVNKEDALLSSVSSAGNELLGFAAVFAAAFTLTLFVYEVRGILRCDGLIQRGKEIEGLLGIRGQFWQCAAEHKPKEGPTRSSDMAKLFNTTIAACLVYSFVFSAWVFLALRYGYGVEFFGCAATAVVLGGLIGFGAYFVVRRAVPA